MAAQQHHEPEPSTSSSSYSSSSSSSSSYLSDSAIGAGIAKNPPSSTATDAELDAGGGEKNSGGEAKKRKRSSEGKHPVFHGVRMRSWGKWVSEIREPRKKSRIWLGTFRTAEMAARAHDVAAIAIKGSSAHLNFPDLAASLPQAASAAPKDVQAAAALAASFGEPQAPSSDVDGSGAASTPEESATPSTSGGGGHGGLEDELFDLPDLFVDAGDVANIYSYSSAPWSLEASEFAPLLWE